MKIRMKGNSVRLRLTQSEVSEFCDKGNVEDRVDFGSTVLGYRLEAKEDIETLRVTFENNLITMFMPEKWKRGWDLNDIVGFDNGSKTASHQEPMLLVEKDFTCMDNSMEDQSDNYPNPKLQG